MKRFRAVVAVGALAVLTVLSGCIFVSKGNGGGHHHHRGGGDHCRR